MDKVLIPATLQEAVIHFADPKNCLKYLASKRWADGVVICPICGGTKVGFLENQLRWQCSARHPKRQFSVKVGTIFEDSPLGLDKWLPVVWLIVNAKNGISSWEIHRAIGVTQKTAWFMLHRVRLAMQAKNQIKMSGEVEADETFVGGKIKNMNSKTRARKILADGRLSLGGSAGKAIVMGLLERHGGHARVKVMEGRKRKHLAPEIVKNVEKGSAVFTDQLKSYDGLLNYAHEVIDHTEAYVRGNVHTNGLENFWSLFKRALKGTYVSVEPFHLQAYADEQCFRYNNRKDANNADMNDAQRFDAVIEHIVGKRLTYAELTGKEAAGEAF